MIDNTTKRNYGAEPECLNTIEFPDGCKVGAWLKNELTTHGCDCNMGRVYPRSDTITIIQKDTERGN